MNNPIFTARVTTDVLPRLAVDFGQRSLFKKDEMDGATCIRLAVKAERQIKIHLDKKTVMSEAAKGLGHAHDSGKSLILRQATHTTYIYEDDYEEGELENFSKVTLQIKDSNLIVKFSSSLVPPSLGPLPEELLTGVENLDFPIWPL